MELSKYLVSLVVTYLGNLQPTYIGVIIYLLSTMDIPVGDLKSPNWQEKTTYIYCLLVDYMLPTTFYGNQKQPLIKGGGGVQGEGVIGEPSGFLGKMGEH